MSNILLSMIKRIYWFDDALQDALKTNGLEPLSRAQIFVIANIAGGEHRASNIARNLGVSRQAISQILSELSRRCMIDVLEDPSHKRSRIVQFSPSFLEDGHLCTSIFAELEEELGRRIGTSRLNNLRDALDVSWGDSPHLGRLEEADV